MTRKSPRYLSKAAGTHDWGGAVELADIGGEVSIVGVGETAFTGASNRDNKAMALEAIEAALEDAGIAPHEVDGLMVSFGIAKQLEPQDYRDHFGTTQDIWFSDQGGAMIWAATCAHDAAMAIRARAASVIVNVFAVDWATARQNGSASPGDWHASEALKSALEMPYGWYPQPLYFATFMRRHMHEFGTTEEQLAAIPVTFRQHASSHPGAKLREKAMSTEAYLELPMIADPFRVADCCLISDGAGAFVMTSIERAKDCAQPSVVVAGVGRGVIDGAPYISQQKRLTGTPQTFSAPWAFAMADIMPRDIDVIGVYDCFSGTALMQIEDMGFCEKGAGGEYVADGNLHFQRTRLQGGIPCNTHGGLLSHAYVLGISHVIELVRQLRGEAANQVIGAEVAAYAGFTAEEASTLVLRCDA